MKIGILNHLGGGNLGDDATLDALMQSIRARRPEAEIRAFSMNPEDTEWRHKVPSHPIRRQRWTFTSASRDLRSKAAKSIAAQKATRFAWFPRRFLASALRLPINVVRESYFLLKSRRAVKDLDLMIIGGGGQLTERDGTWAFPYTLLKWVMLARSCGVSCEFVNVGAGPITSRLSKLFTARALAAADYVSFRDPESQELARRIGFSGVSEVYPDSVYALSFVRRAEPPSTSRTGRVVGISPVPCGDRGFNPREKGSAIYTRALAQWTAFIRMLIAEGYTVQLFGTDVGSDFVVIDDVLECLQEEGVSKIPEVCEVKTLDELLAAIASMDFVITSRFHGIIFAHLMQKPVLALANHHKVSHLMSSLGLSRYCEDLQSFDSGDVLNRFRALVNDANAVKNKMTETLADNRTKLALQFDRLFPPICPATGAPREAIGSSVENLHVRTSGN